MRATTPNITFFISNKIYPVTPVNIYIYSSVSSISGEKYKQKSSFPKEPSCIYDVVVDFIVQLFNSATVGNYLFDRVGPFLAFFKPGFFLSLILGSLLSNPYGFKVSLNSGFHSINALANPSLIASACPDIPQPLTTISASNILR